MANGNPYYVEPANIMPGLQMLGKGIQRRAGFERERVKSSQDQKIRDDAAQLFKTGTPEEIADYRIKHPEVSKDIEASYKFKSEQTRENKLDSLRRILIDREPPAQVLIERAEMVEKEGGNYQETLDDAKEAMVNEQGAYDKALKEYSMLASKDEWKQYQQGQGEGVTGGKPTADIINYGQAKEGGYTGSFMDFLAEKKTKPDTKTKDIKEFEYGKANPDFAKEEETTGFGDFTEEQKNEMADQYTESGKFEFTGRSMEIKKHNAEIKKRSLERQKAKGVDAINTYYNQLDKKGMTADINAQQKKFGSMRSFAGNIDKQAKKIDEVGKRLYKYDTKILNVPINVMMKKIVGSPDRAVMELLIGELSEEIGKLASGATDSVAALSEGGREKWDAIFDTNLSFNDLNALVAESKEVAHMRIDSMKESLAESRRIRKGGKIKKVTRKYNPTTGGFD